MVQWTISSNPEVQKNQEKYDKYEDEIKAHVFRVLPEEYKPVRVYFNVNISNIEYKYFDKEIHWFWKIDLVGKRNKKKIQKRRF